MSEIATDRVREVSRMTKAQLVGLVLADARGHGRRWVLGGPETWSKDELVSYVIHEVPVGPVRSPERVA